MGAGNNQERITETQWKTIVEMIKGIQFGTVSIIIQDGKVIQVERTEKLRFKN